MRPLAGLLTLVVGALVIMSCASTGSDEPAGIDVEPSPADGSQPDSGVGSDAVDGSQPDSGPETGVAEGARSETGDGSGAVDGSGEVAGADSGVVAGSDLGADSGVVEIVEIVGPVLEVVPVVEEIEIAGGGASSSGARSDPLVDPLGSDEADDAEPADSEIPPAQGPVYTWQDGDRTLQAQLHLDLVAVEAAGGNPAIEVVADMGQGQVIAHSVGPSSEAVGASDSGVSPVFVSDSGTLMTLPGGVLLIVDPEWSEGRVDGFFESAGISRDRLSELSYAVNGFFVETEPGFASLDLANTLAALPGVELSSPNWWREHTTR